MLFETKLRVVINKILKNNKGDEIDYLYKSQMTLGFTIFSFNFSFFLLFSTFYKLDTKFLL